MTDMRAEASSEAFVARPEEIQTHLKHLDRRQWWLWSSTVAVILLLTIACVNVVNLVNSAENPQDLLLITVLKGAVFFVTDENASEA